MTLTPGTRLGPYEIVAPLGAGGMGEVYRATDTKLRRHVALKVLPMLLSSDPQRMARFEREAQFLAALNHPNIAGIYGLEDSAGISALVMELVEGPTLSERIMRSQIKTDEVLSLAKQLADALEYAHERRIIHRDLKPANLKVRPDGTLKVLDFGLAKALADEAATTNVHDSPTLTAEATGAGVVLGTAAYMSPEQARGRPVDRRADIWSFGCVLFEMLSGRLAFEGETVTDTLSAILTKEPDWSRLPSTAPLRICGLLRRCLQKDARKRLQSIGDARIEIEECLASQDSTDSVDPDGSIGGQEPARQSVRKPLLAASLAAAALVVLAGLVGWWLKGTRTRTFNWTGTAVPGSNIAFGPRISPDGHMLAFQAMVGNLTQVAVVNLDSGTWAVLTHDENRGFVNEISWAPDGSKLFFDRVVAVPKGIYSVPAMGGAERLVLEDAGTPETLPDGTLIVARNDTASRLRIYHYWPDSQRLDPLAGWVTLGTTIPLRIFPDGKELVFFGGIKSPESADHLYAMDIATGNSRRLAPELKVVRLGEGFPIAATPDGRAVVIDMHSGDLHRLVAIPRDGGRSSKEVVTVTRSPWYLDFSKDGTLYTDEIDRPHEVLRLPEEGGTPEVMASSDYLRVPDLSYMDPVQITDGRTLFDTRLSGRGQVLVGTPGGNFFPLLETKEESSAPATSLPKDEVAFVLGSGDAQTIAIASADQGRLLRRLQGTKGKNIETLAASPDGNTLYYSSSGTVWAIPVIDGTPRQIAKGDNVAVDPNGRDLVIRRNEGSDSRLFRVSVSGGRTQEIPVPGDWSLAPVNIGQSAVAKNGKILIPVSPRDSWFYRLAILDPASGVVTGIPITYMGDTINGDWAGDGRILAVGLPLKGHIWRFTKVAGGN
jgi:eukaryotic-like serine/threonine-protein kinase